MDTNRDVKSTIIEFVNSNFLMGTNSIKFSDDDSFLEKGIVDSTGVLEMVSFIQKNFNIAVDDSELIPENLDSVNSIASYIQKKQMKQCS
ncbi:Acyl carrier protein [Chitinispirillum alkaliphilum]|nr:Acyl carrier protein [Chitinispirillum alkaliphilum]